MAVSGLPAPPRRVLESFPEPPRAILERSETPPEHPKRVFEAINVSKRAPGRSKTRSGSSKDSLCNLSTIESASFPASISTFVACPSKKNKTLRLRCGLCVPPRLRSPIGLGGGREAQTKPRFAPESLHCALFSVERSDLVGVLGGAEPP